MIDVEYINILRERIDKIKKINYKKKFKEYKYLLKPLLILIIIYSLAYYPIIRANYKYIDDMGRVLWGYRNWLDFSRYISEYLSIFVHSSTYLTDISPLTQIISIILLSIASVILLYLFKKDKKISFINIISVTPIGLTPYFLECISYKYDCVYMSLSILACVFPFVFFDKNKKFDIKFIFSIFVGTLIMCTSYQATSGGIPMIALFLSFNLWNDKKDKNALYLLINSAIGYLFGLLFFKIFLMIPTDNYVSNQIFPLNTIIPGYFTNLFKYYKELVNDFRNIWLYLLISIIIIFVIIQIIKSKKNKIISGLLSYSLIMLSLFLAFGIYPFFTNPLYVPRAMYGLCFPIALFTLNIALDNKFIFNKLLVFAFCWTLFTFSFTYGNSLFEQQKYVDFRVNNVIDGLNDLEIMNNENVKYIKVQGNIDNAPSIDNMPNDYKIIINRLIPISFGGGGWYWNTAYFAYYFKLKNIIVYEWNLDTTNFEVLKDTMYYKIESDNENHILLTLK